MSNPASNGSPTPSDSISISASTQSILLTGSMASPSSFFDNINAIGNGVKSKSPHASAVICLSRTMMDREIRTNEAEITIPNNLVRIVLASHIEMVKVHLLQTNS